MIRKTLIAAAALAALTTGFAGHAEARTYSNRITLNGFALNGAKLNGFQLNGINLNGAAAQSAAPVIEGVILPSGVILLAR